MIFLVCLFFFFKQKTAYEMRISDWSSDVCSSDLKHGSVAAWLTRVPHVVNALTGLGALFIGSSAKTRHLGRLARAILKPLLNRRGSRVILQNADDRRLLAQRGLLSHARVSSIRGSRLDPARFIPMPAPDGPTGPVAPEEGRV